MNINKAIQRDRKHSRKQKPRKVSPDLDQSKPDYKKSRKEKENRYLTISQDAV